MQYRCVDYLTKVAHVTAFHAGRSIQTLIEKCIHEEERLHSILVSILSD